MTRTRGTPPAKIAAPWLIAISTTPTNRGGKQSTSSRRRMRGEAHPIAYTERTEKLAWRAKAK